MKYNIIGRSGHGKRTLSVDRGHNAIVIEDHDGVTYYLESLSAGENSESVAEFFEAHKRDCSRLDFSPILVGSADPLRFSMPHPLEVGGVWIENDVGEYVLDTSRIQYFITE